MLPNNDDNISGGPSLIWTIKTAFNNYQTIIDKYENLLLENVALNTSVTEKLGELSTKLEKMPDRYTLSNVDNKLSKISEKLTKMILIVAIVGGIGISTYIWINHQIDKRIENIIKQTTNKIINTRPEQLQRGGKLYVIDAQGKKLQVLLDHEDDDQQHRSK
jgi:hypothetical protein